MAHLMDQGEHIVQGVGVVQQHKGVYAVHTGRVSARALTGINVHIDPAVGKAFLQDGAVLRPQGRQRFQGHLFAFGKGNGHLLIGHHRGVHIIVVQFVHTQQPLAQFDIAVHGGQVLVHGFDQVVVDLHRDFGLGQGGMQRRRILPGFGKELQLLHLGAQHGGTGVFQLAIPCIQGVEGGFPQGAVGGFHQGAVAAVGQRVGVALAVHRIRKGQVGIVHQGKDVARGLAHAAGSRQQFFLRSGEGVVLFAADAVHRQPVMLQPGLRFIKGSKTLLGDGQQFRGFKGQCLPPGHNEVIRPGAHLLVGRLTGVLVGLAVGVGNQPVPLFRHLVLQLQECQQGGGAVVQVTRIPGQLLQNALQAFIVRLPGIVVGVQVGDLPGIGRVHLAAFPDILCHGIDSFYSRLRQPPQWHFDMLVCAWRTATFPV